MRTHDLIAKGPEELKQALSNLLKKQQAKLNPSSAEQSHFILYELAEQKSLIKVKIDPSALIFISHYDLLGRSATPAVKKSILEFIKNECDGRGHLEDVSGQEMLARNMISFVAAEGDKSRVILSKEEITLEHAREQLDRASTTRERFALFQSEENLSPNISKIDNLPNKLHR